MTNRSPRRLPEEIYVRRRVAAVVLILLCVGLLVWGLVRFAGGSEQSGGQTVGAQSSSAVASSTETTSAESTSAQSSSAETTSAQASGEEETSTEQTSAEQTSANAAAKDSCELGDLRIVASSDRPAYGGDAQPTFYMSVENPTAADCLLDLDDAELRFEVYNLATNERVWADTDCYPSVVTGEETFPAGQTRNFQAVWSRLGSQPGQCSNRTSVPAGSYFLHAVIGSNPSDAHTFNLG